MGRPRKWTPENPKPKPEKKGQRPPMDRHTWLKEHPEDIVIDNENMAARTRGYDDNGLRSLMAAMCLRTIIDYKNAVEGKTYNTPTQKNLVAIIENCEEAFTDDLFAFFTNGLSPDEIRSVIINTPKEDIHAITYVINKNLQEESQKMQGLL